ncbi:MAG: diacylglycerol/lipid kinase family protein [Bacteroidota bacterium]|jgi:diacylglycerol kinase (ATP)
MQPRKILFIINPFSGSRSAGWIPMIEAFFSGQPVEAEFWVMTTTTLPEQVTEIIQKTTPNLVVAVGGDGTIKLVATALLNIPIPLGILPAGSANGLAYELGIPENTAAALQVLIAGKPRPMHALSIQNEICLHLADLGLNAWAMKRFNRNGKRGMWGYASVSLQALYYARSFHVSLNIDDTAYQEKAAMVVLANGTAYRTGAVINPNGSLFDDHFEVVIMKQISIIETLKMLFRQRSFNPEKLVIHAARKVRIQCKKRVPFQIDGEFRGKVRFVEAHILPEAIQIWVPA